MLHEWFKHTLREKVGSEYIEREDVSSVVPMVSNLPGPKKRGPQAARSAKSMEVPEETSSEYQAESSSEESDQIPRSKRRSHVNDRWYYVPTLIVTLRLPTIILLQWQNGTRRCSVCIRS